MNGKVVSYLVWGISVILNLVNQELSAYPRTLTGPFVICPKRFRLNQPETVAIFANFNETIFIEVKDAVRQTEVLYRSTKTVTSGKATRMRVLLDKLPPSGSAVLHVNASDGEIREGYISIVDTVGFVFIQTDKPIYRPEDTVRMRLLRLDENLKLLEEAVRLKIKNPQRVTTDVVDFNAFPKAFLEYNFTIPPNPIFGKWYILAYYGPSRQGSTNVSFDVTDLAPPKFAIRTFSSKFVSPGMEYIRGAAIANYTYRKPVIGTVVFKFGLKSFKTGKIAWMSSTKSEVLSSNPTTWTFATNVIKKSHWYPSVKAYAFIVETTVTENATGISDAVFEIYDFIDKPYKVSFVNAYSSFKPCEKLILTAQILDHRNEPVNNLPVIVSEKHKNFTATVLTDLNGEILLSFRAAKYDKKLEFVYTTADPLLSTSDQTGVQYVMHLQETNTAYVVINNKPKRELQVGETYRSNISLHGHYVEPLRIYVIAIVRGHIHSVKRLCKEKTYKLAIEPSMAPLVRILVMAYTSLPNYPFSADSFGLKVADTDCELRASFIFRAGIGKQIHPGDFGQLMLHGTPGDNVAIQAVDEAVLEQRKQPALSIKKILAEVASGDPGCGLGGGWNSLDVILNTGMLLVGAKSWIQGSKCQEQVKPKTDLDFSANESVARVAGRYLEKEASNNLRGRGSFVQFNQEAKLEEAAVVRSDWRETWLFEVVTLRGDNAQLNISIPHSITTWALEAMTLSAGRRLCMLRDPLKLSSLNSIFMEVTLPATVVINEQVEISVTVFNYGSELENVIVYMYGHRHVCSEAEKGEKSKQRKMTLQPNTLKRTKFSVVPLKVGKFDIKFVALSNTNSDVVIKTLTAVHAGIKFELHYQFVLDPQNVLARDNLDSTRGTLIDEINSSSGIHRIMLDIRPPEDRFVITPNSEDCIMSMVAVEPVASKELFPEARKRRLSIRAPTVMSEPLFYLEHIGKGQHLQPELWHQAIMYLKRGYQRELMLRIKDGSFCPYTQADASSCILKTVLTMKVLCLAYPYIKDVMDPKVLNSGIRWILENQNEDGSWKMNNHLVFNQNISGVNSQLLITAFALTSLNECSRVKDVMDTNKYGESARKAENFINQHRENIMQLRNALVSAATALRLDFMQNPLFYNQLKDVNSRSHKHSTSDSVPWTKFNTTESAFYARMSTSNQNSDRYSNALSEASNIFESLGVNDYDTHQDTLEILGMLPMLGRERTTNTSLDMVCHMSSKLGRFQKFIKLDDSKSMVLQKFRADIFNDTLGLVAQGKGVARVKVLCQYYSSEPDTGSCEFELTLNVEELINGFPRKHRALRTMGDGPLPNQTQPDPFDIEYFVDNDGNELPPKNYGGSFEAKSSTAEDDTPNEYVELWLEVCLHHLAAFDAGPRTVDVSMISGYVPNKESLEDLTSDKDSFISKYEVTDRKVMVYLVSVPHEQPFCFSLRAVRQAVVISPESGFVTVRDQNGHGHECSQAYSLKILNTVCNSHVCKCSKRNKCPIMMSLSDIRIIRNQEKLAKLLCFGKFELILVGNVNEVQKVGAQTKMALLVSDAIKGDQNYQGSTEVVTMSIRCYRSHLQAPKHGSLIIFANRTQAETVLDGSTVVLHFKHPGLGGSQLTRMQELIAIVKNLVTHNSKRCK